MSQRGAGSLRAGSRGFVTPGFHGHGLEFETVPATIDSEVELLKQENEKLQEQLQYHQQLLQIWQQQPCAICQLGSNYSGNATAASQRLSTHSATTATGSSSSRARRSNTSGVNNARRTDCSKAATAGSPGPDCAAAGPSCWQQPLDKALRQQQVLIAQLQRQVMILQIELESRDQLVQEADTILAEAYRRLSSIVAVAAESATLGSSNSGSTAAVSNSAAISNRASRGSSASSSGVGRPPAAAAGRGSSSNSRAVTPAAGVVAVADQVLERSGNVALWCKTAAARISRTRAECAAMCRAAQSSCMSSIALSSGGSLWNAEKCDGDGAVSNLQQLQLQYLPAGGNKYLQSSAKLTLTSLSQGQALSLLHLPALFFLMQRLASLAQPLADLAVQLRTIVLPVLPWLAAGSLGQQLPVSCAVIAQTAAEAASELVELCSVLPAIPGTLSSPAVAAARRAVACKAGAACEAEAWGSGMSDFSSSHSMHTDAAITAGLTSMQLDSRQQQRQQQQQLIGAQGERPCNLQAADQQLLDGLAHVLDAIGPNLKHDKGSSSSAIGSSRGITSANPQRKPHSSQDRQHLQQQAKALLQQVRQRWEVLCFKKQALDTQLSFVARCSAEQAKLVLNLVQQVAAAVAAAAEGFEQEHGLQDRRSAALQLVRQLQRAAVLLQQQGQRAGDGGGSSALRGLAGILENYWEVLDDLPEVLQASNADAIKAAALAAVADAFEAFRSELQQAQKVCTSSEAASSF